MSSSRPRSIVLLLRSSSCFFKSLLSALSNGMTMIAPRKHTVLLLGVS